MKRIIILILTTLLIATTGCTSGMSDDGIVDVVVTIFPAYDWTEEIVGDTDGIRVELLMDNGVDLHSFQPTVDDMVAISNCDVLVCVGGPSDEWLEPIIEEAQNEDMIVVRLTDMLELKESEVVEGMEHAHECGDECEVHGHDHDECGDECEVHGHDHDHDDHDHHDEDEHIWLSLRCAQTACAAIRDALMSVDADNAAVYSENADAYISELNALDARYAEAVENGKFDTLLFADRFPFLYMTDDYGINYYAAFTGCSSETEADFETVAFLANKIDELGLESVMTIEHSDKALAETVIRTSKSKPQNILELDSMQSVTREQAEEGISYISVMESNLEVLKAALGTK